jgi:hypothetical protein
VAGIPSIRLSRIHDRGRLDRILKIDDEGRAQRGVEVAGVEAEWLCDLDRGRVSDSLTGPIVGIDLYGMVWVDEGADCACVIKPGLSN